VTGGHPALTADRRAQLDALRIAADWAADHPELPEGSIEARPGGQVRVHLFDTPGRAAPGVAVRRLAETTPVRELHVSEARERIGARWRRLVELRLPVPGIELVVWCYEDVPPPASPPGRHPTRAEAAALRGRLPRCPAADRPFVQVAAW
jgi:hypothetical protein